MIFLNSIYTVEFYWLLNVASEYYVKITLTDRQMKNQ